MPIKNIIIIMLLTIASINNSIAHNDPEHSIDSNVLKVLSEKDFIPYNYYNKDGEFTGIAVDIVEEMLSGATFKHTKIRIIPWSRAYHLTQTEPNTMLFSIYKTDERKDLFDWVGPIATEDIVILMKKGQKVDKDNYIIAASRDSASAQATISSGFPFEHIMRTNSTNTGLKLLNMGRADAWAVNYTTAAHSIKNAGLSINDYFIYKKLDSLKIHIALSKTTRPEIKNFFIERFQELKKSGFIDKAIAKHKKECAITTH